MMAPMGSVHRRFNNANIEALRQLRCEIHLLANFEKGRGSEQQNPVFARKCENEGIIVHSLPFVRASLFGNLGLVKHIRELLQQENFDLVHAHTETGGLLLRLSLGTSHNSRYVYTPHGMSFYKGAPLKARLLFKPIEKWICGAMDANLGMNMEEFDVLTRWNKASANYVHGIGLNVERFKGTEKSKSEIRNELGISDDAILICSVGELDDNKNHSIVVRTIAELHNQKIYYIICGVGPNHDSLTELAIQSGLQDHIILAGYRKDIPDILHASDLFVFPSFHEGLPVSLMEAMASGLPVICSEIRGNVDLVKNGVNGLLFSPDNYSQLSKAIAQILSDKKRMAEMGAQNSRDVENYSYSVVVEELKQIYQKNLV